MDFYRTFHIVTYLLVLIGLGATLLTNALPIFAQIVVGILATISLLMRLSGRNPTIPKRLKNTLSLTVLLFLITDIFFVHSNLLMASIRFLIIIEILKLFDLNSNKDYLQLYTIVFFQIISAAASTTSIAFFSTLILFTVFFTWTMILFHLKREGENNNNGGQSILRSRATAKDEVEKRIPDGVVTPAFLSATAFVSLLSFVTTMFIFFIMPRLGVGIIQKGFVEGTRLSGFSEKVDLGDIGRVKLDPTAVMRVELPEVDNPLKLSIYWRGRAFDHFDGFRWSQTYLRKSLLRRNNKGIFLSHKTHRDSLRDMNGAIKVLKQKITLEPLDTEVIFAASYGIGVSGNLSWPRMDDMSAIYLSRPPFKRLEYTAYSRLFPMKALSMPSTGRKNDKVGGESTLKKYLQLFNDGERIRGLANAITKGLKKPEEKAKAVYKYLKENYRYKLNAPWKGEGDPLEAFLFETKEGYCEQFSTAMAVLLRHTGVPTRLITGFLRGEWNKYGRYFLVRQKDAHSWVEVYLPSTGWTTFDPTPTVEIGRGTMLSPYILLFDSLKHKWNRYIIRYSIGDQLRILSSIKGKTTSMGDSLKDLSTNLMRYIREIRRFSLLNIGVVSSFPLALIFLIHLIKKIRWRRVIKGGGVIRIGLDFYLRMLKILERKGIKKGKGITPGEFATHIILTHGSNLQGVIEITDLYHKVRFGGVTMDRERWQRVGEILSGLEGTKVKTG